MSKTAQSKSGFIKQFALSVPIEDVIAAAEANGITGVTRQAIHGTRWAMREKIAKSSVSSKKTVVRKVAARKAQRKVQPKNAVRARPPQDPIELEYVRLALRVGLEKSRRMLDQIEAYAVELAGG